MKRTDTFIDTNVLLYLTDDDLQKAQRAEELLREGGVISVQVLDEFANVASRKMRVPWPALHDLLQAIRLNLLIEPTDLRTHDLGLHVSERYRFSIYDAMLLAAALQASCTTFWSEDLHDGQVIEGALTIRNPFAQAS